MPASRALELFSTPVFVVRTEGNADLNRELKTRITREAQAQAGMKRSNVGGWHSEQDLLTRPEACYQRLGEVFVGGFRQALGSAAQHRGVSLSDDLGIGGVAWAMIMGPGEYSQLHHHGEAHWAGVYYVDAGDPPPDDAPAQAGCLSLVDPRGAVYAENGLDLFKSTFDIRPADGLLVFFPGWLMHHVHPYRGSRPRISIACNLQVKNQA